MKKMGIKFGDNDFYYTFQNVMLNILGSYTLNPRDTSNLNKKQIVKIINGLSEGCYWLHQNRFRYELGWDAKAYLHIKEDKVLIDEEVDEYLKDDKRHNGDFYYINFILGEIGCA